MTIKSEISNKKTVEKINEIADILLEFFNSSTYNMQHYFVRDSNIREEERECVRNLLEEILEFFSLSQRGEIEVSQKTRAIYDTLRELYQEKKEEWDNSFVKMVEKYMKD